MDPMMKMWVSFVGLGLMALSAILVTFARYKTKGALRGLLSFVAFVMLFFGFIVGAFVVLT
ncbi:DUF2768 domain-containing protein [Paenibacillus xylaniclasticus]|uniref:DUF2768 domain-containing protein n=1 Tax=Paenibacillus xylaniclasticus TaxID=588083 RepID=UPI000FDBFC04|nr:MULTISPECIES: DUF2768 domain-containing protein [Paenibacillus]GFN30631.1 hypothetical protein PCURB6_08910 [Paenibacillus curdlanolyticus]